MVLNRSSHLGVTPDGEHLASLRAMSLNVGGQIRPQEQPTSSKAVSQGDGARGTGSEASARSGSRGSAGGNSFCCGKSCCSGGRSQGARNALNIDPSRLMLEMRRRLQEQANEASAT